MSRFYLTTAIDYVNSRPHLGTAYEKITADVIARYRRLSGLPTLFLMGNDEHSQNVFQRARELSLEPRVYCDQMEVVFREAWSRLNISFDDFIRTTEDRHRVAVTALVQRIADAGDLYEGFYEGWYCVSCEAFKQEKDLVNGECPLHLKRPEWIKEKNHFFRLSKYQRALLDHFHQHPDFVEPDIRRNEILRLLEGGLEDISISRTGQAWGIPLPFDPASVVYVWVDALINYVSAVGYGADATMFKRWWPVDLHIVGKDITRFHCVVWPAMLLSAGLPLPRKVFGHGWVHWKGQRMSKSLGTALDPLVAAERLGPDPLRLYLVKEIPYGYDGDFTWERFEERYNVDLANNFGNLVNRVAVMAHRYQQGRLAPPASAPGPLAAEADAAVGRYRAAMEAYRLHDAAAAVFGLVDATNEFIARSEPWSVARDPARTGELNQQLYEMAEAVRIAALLLSPVMPASCAEILTSVGDPRRIGEMRLDRDAAWSSAGERRVIRRDPMWPRVDRDAPSHEEPPSMTEQLSDKTPSLAPPTGTAPEQPSTPPPRMSFGEFMKLDLRVATVLAAEPVPKSKKLLKLDVDLGTERRTIVAGIAGAYAPEALTGRTVIMVANLEPAKLMGVESNGMVLAATAENDRPVLLTVDDVGLVAPGMKVR